MARVCVRRDYADRNVVSIIMSDESTRSASYGSAGAAAAIGIAGLLVPTRDVIGNTNVALVLVVVIVAAATLGGRLAGAMTAGAACLSFNFFHTQPLYTLRVHSADDIWTITLLFAIGLVVGQLAVFARMNQTKALIERAGLVHLEEIGAMVAEDQLPDTVWPAVQAALVNELTLVAATFEPGDQPATETPATMATLERNGRFDVKAMFWSREGMELPRDGVSLPVQAGERSFGRIVLIPSPGRGTTRDQRRVAVALADLLAVTLDRHPPIADRHQHR
jgi:K+-sensing histidine kinase KdpD